MRFSLILLIFGMMLFASLSGNGTKTLFNSYRDNICNLLCMVTDAFPRRMKRQSETSSVDADGNVTRCVHYSNGAYRCHTRSPIRWTSWTAGKK